MLQSQTATSTSLISHATTFAEDACTILFTVCSMCGCSLSAGHWGAAAGAGANHRSVCLSRNVSAQSQSASQHPQWHGLCWLQGGRQRLLSGKRGFKWMHVCVHSAVLLTNCKSEYSYFLILYDLEKVNLWKLCIVIHSLATPNTYLVLLLPGHFIRKFYLVIPLTGNFNRYS